MKRPSQAELTNLIPNLQALGRVRPGDKLNVTSDQFSVQAKGFFSQSVARTFSRNSARAYYLPVYRQFQIAVVDRLWNGQPQPWAEIDAAFAGLQNLRQTYVLELEEAAGKGKSQAVLAQKQEKVDLLDRLILAVSLLVNTPRNVNPERFWAAAPRGYGRSRIFRISQSIKQRVIQTRQFALQFDTIPIAFDQKANFDDNVLPEFDMQNLFRRSDRFREIQLKVSHQFVVDALERHMTLLFQGALPFDHHNAGSAATLNYYLHRLHGDVAMLQEISVWCNQGVLGSAINYIMTENAIGGGYAHPFLTTSGLRCGPSAGGAITKFNLFEVRFRKAFGIDQKLHDEVAEVAIHVHVETDPATFQTGIAFYTNRPMEDPDYGDPGSNARCPIQRVVFDFDFVIHRNGPNSFSYEIMNDQVYFETKPDEPSRENPRWMIQMDANVA
jgi:hypothetical protein